MDGARTAQGSKQPANHAIMTQDADHFHILAKENYLHIVTPDCASVKIVCHSDRWVFNFKEFVHTKIDSYETFDILRPVPSIEFFAKVRKEFDSLKEDQTTAEIPYVADASILWERMQAHLPIKPRKPTASQTKIQRKYLNGSPNSSDEAHAYSKEGSFSAIPYVRFAVPPHWKIFCYRFRLCLIVIVAVSIIIVLSVLGFLGSFD